MKQTKTSRRFKLFKESRLFKAASAALILGACLTIGYFYLSSHKLVREIYEAETRSTIVEFKKNFLKNTVDNFISQLKEEQLINEHFYKESVENHYFSLMYALSLPCSDFMKTITNEFELESSGSSDNPKWTVLVWDSNGTILYAPKYCDEKPLEAALEEIKPRMSSYRILEHSGLSCLFGYSIEHVKNAAKTKAAAAIKNMHFEYGSYMWVNEVLSYSGGDNYAIRRVHPNLPETEGMYLSTDMEDIAGNRPYLVELEGVKRYGSLFISYHFQELNSDSVSEKLAYARLYKEFDWIIAMGIHYNEMDEYIASTNEKAQSLASSKTLQVLASLIVLVLAFITAMLLWEKQLYTKSKEIMEQELNTDALTGAKSRKFGISYLEQAFKRFNKDSSLTAALIIFDIDSFKKINDVYGHLEGDRVLREIVLAAAAAIRSSDIIFRLGGDEFVCIFNGVNESSAMLCAEKVLNAVAALKFMVKDTQLALSVSIGLSCFLESDSGYVDALKRADTAMYISKENGGNRLTAG